MQLKENLRTELEKMAKKKLNRGLVLARFNPKLVPKFFFVVFTFTRCYNVLKAMTVCNFKEN